MSWSRERHLKCPFSKNVKELPETLADSWFLMAGPQQLPNSILGEWQGADRPEAPRAMVTQTSQVSSDSKDSRVSSILIPLLDHVPTDTHLNLLGSISLQDSSHSNRCQFNSFPIKLWVEVLAPFFELVIKHQESKGKGGCWLTPTPEGSAGAQPTSPLSLSIQLKTQLAERCQLHSEQSFLPGNTLTGHSVVCLISALGVSSSVKSTGENQPSYWRLIQEERAWSIVGPFPWCSE